MQGVLIAAVPALGGVPGDHWYRLMGDDGEPAGPPRIGDASVMAAIERDHRPRWIFDATIDVYPALLAAGVTVERCHDVTLIERILLGREGRFDEPCHAPAVVARRDGREPPSDPAAVPPAGVQPALFEPDADRADPAARLAEVVAAHADQLARVDASAGGPAAAEAGIAVAPGALRLLMAVESGSALVAAEMTRTGLPWDAAEHERILVETLGPRPVAGSRPARMAELAAEISAAFGFAVNPDSAVDLRAAFRRVGFDIDTTRAWVIRELDHPAVAPVLAYKDLSRLYTANGWNWLGEWVSEGRLVSEYLPGGVVSGRWATRGGGGLQLPKAIRSAAVARPGHVLVVADAAQLEPRVLAAVSGDRALATVTASPAGSDLYDGLAADGFGGDRRHAKVAMLGAMYGQTTGEAARLMATLRRRYPAAIDFVEAAARRGEAGDVVCSVLGRACPPPSTRWFEVIGSAREEDERRARQWARDRGRFTRNFVVQASAADWAAAWLTGLRLALRNVPGAELVFFQHDELIVHVPVEFSEQVAALAVSTADAARELVFPGTRVLTPVRPIVVERYSDAK
jgi:DNA polymerase-1